MVILVRSLSDIQMIQIDSQEQVPNVYENIDNYFYICIFYIRLVSRARSYIYILFLVEKVIRFITYSELQMCIITF